MGVPAFYRWLSEKYPKIVQDVLEERVPASGTTPILPLDISGPNPSGLECDNLYIDMNGIIHPCSHPELGPQPSSEEEMYENVCHAVDRLMRIVRPRQCLFLAIDGVAPRAKMNQQRARRFRSSQEARELTQLEQHVRTELQQAGQAVPTLKPAAWDSNVITPGTPFMLRLSEYIRFYIRQRMATDKAWKPLRVIFSDASLRGEGEHKIMSHIRLQRAQPGYNPNTVHVLHGLDADLIMLALATHEAHFYISRELVMFGRKSQEMLEQRQEESGFRLAQQLLDQKVGPDAMALLINQQKPLQRVSIPILREYLAAEFATVLHPHALPFQPSLERLIDDVVFMCFFVGNDFLPHLPSLDIRDGGLDYLFNVYKRLLPSLGDYITQSGGKVDLSHVDVLLAQVGSIEDYVFSMKHENERQEIERRNRFAKKGARQPQRDPPPPPVVIPHSQPKVMGRAARILEKQQQQQLALSRGHQAKEDARHALKAQHMMTTTTTDQNEAAARALKASLVTGGGGGDALVKQEAEESSETNSKNVIMKTEQAEEEEEDAPMEDADDSSPSLVTSKRPRDGNDETVGKDVTGDQKIVKTSELGVVGEAEDEFDADDDDDDDVDEKDIDVPKIEDTIVSADPEVAYNFKEKVKAVQQKKLDEHSQSVVDNVRLHEAGWKDRYYTDKCKADDISGNGGREHLFRTYVMGLCWVMKYYYDGCPSWKFYYPFHYAPFASDLKNIERFEKDCRSFELGTPFNPVEQLMAVLPSDSKLAIPKAARWLMDDSESPIIDFYPKDVPVDPNGKAMPWLWVVLLPFIDEDRLLAAMSPTMTKWTKEELLCNAVGLDDGYLYVHRSNPLAKKMANVLQPGKTAKSPKTKLTDGAAYGCSGFSGSVRPPLSNELYPIDEDVTIPPPATAGRIDRTSEDNIFAESIENVAACVAFSEPLKLSHKSVVLPGAKFLPPVLKDDDKRIRRPRLNRFGGTIANLGTSNGQSYQVGHGSMNIGSYERQLAERTGRGAEMYQTGTRAWGAMEPTPKRIRQAGPPPPPPPRSQQISNPFMRGPPAQPHNVPHGRPPWQQAAPNTHIRYDQQNMNGYHAGQQQQHSYQQPHRYGVAQQQEQQYSGGWAQGGIAHQQGPPYSQNANYQHQRYQQPPPQQQQQGYDFRSNSGPAPPNPHQQRQNTHPPVGAQQRPRASADVMSNLRAQLTNTLKQNRNSGGGQQGHGR